MRWERVLRSSLIVSLITAVVCAIYYLAAGAFGGAEYPFVANSLAKDGFFAALCVLALKDLRRFGFCVWLIAGGYGLLTLGLVAGEIGTGASSFEHTFSWLPHAWAPTFAWGWLGVTAVASGGLAWVYKRYLLAVRAPAPHEAAARASAAHASEVEPRLGELSARSA